MKKTATSSKKPQTRNVKLFDGTIVKTDNNKAPDIKKGLTTKHVIPKKKFSTETGMAEKDWKIEDDFDSLEYPPQGNHPLYRKFWAESLKDIMARENFRESHLGLLDAYCRLRVELKSLDDFIQNNGHTFRVVTVLGEQRKTFPEVNERMKVLGQLARFSSLLDLLPKKDKSKGRATKEEEDEWE